MSEQLKRIYEAEKRARLLAEREANQAGLERLKAEVVKENGLSGEAVHLLTATTPEQLRLQAVALRRVIDAEVAKLQPRPEVQPEPELTPEQKAYAHKRAMVNSFYGGQL